MRALRAQEQDGDKRPGAIQDRPGFVSRASQVNMRMLAALLQGKDFKHGRYRLVYASDCVRLFDNTDCLARIDQTSLTIWPTPYDLDISRLNTLAQALHGHKIFKTRAGNVYCQHTTDGRQVSVMLRHNEPYVLPGKLTWPTNGS